MKAIILAAGQGKRLRPLTNDKPKTMVKLFGRTLLERQIKVFRDCGINDILVVGGYKHETIDFPNIKKYKNLDYNSTNMVETLFCVKNELSENVIISYGDIIFEKEVLKKLIKSTEDFSVVVDKSWKRYWKVRFSDPLNDAESLRLDSKGYIIEIGQFVNNIDEIQGQYIGLMKFQKKGLEHIKKFYEKVKEESKLNINPLNPNISFRESYMTDFIQGLVHNGCKIKAILIQGGWLELDSINDYKIYNQMYQENKLSKFIRLEN